MKLPNDLIKSTDYDKAKDRIIHEFECVNGKVVQHYVLGGEHELTTQEIIDCLNALATIDCDLQTAYAYIKGQEEKIFDLEAKLAEKDEKIKYYKDWLDDVLLTSVDHESYYATINEYEEEISQLKQQIAEKEKEYQSIKKIADENVNYLKNRILEETRSYNQDKISFAVEQLEQLRHDIWTNQADDGYTDMQVDLYDLNDTIDVRIMQIKEGK